MKPPPQVLFIALEPKTEAGREKLAPMLRRLLAEDPTLGFWISARRATRREGEIYAQAID